MVSRCKGISLPEVLQVLETLAPLKLAENWDNVGLLIEPSSPHIVRKLMLTNDLTQPVMEETIKHQCNMIISYHPPIFQALKQLRTSNVKQNLVIQCLENRVAVFSPHTSYDVAADGVNDWLISAFGELRDVKPVTALRDPVSVNHRLLDEDEILRLKSQLSCNGTTSPLSGDISYVSRNFASTLNSKEAIVEVGSGRRAMLSRPLTIVQALERVKSYLGLPFVRVAIGEGKTLDSEVETVACCAGSGSSVLHNCEVDVYLSGEMSHHDVLHATSHGRTVMLCEHSNSERGYLVHLQKKLSLLLPQVEFMVSQSDADPLVVM
ncbi:NIF3L1 [Bugula neritina]|uniref:NIF3-like protein 1 n=1 Tax=Bugula neritina TaxID=10212 RepID=A0A7J7IW18_BUGNE|nr:NIF3L1 [Bugula neritina]